jgi:hypothetical protein
MLNLISVKKNCLVLYDKLPSIWINVLLREQHKLKLLLQDDLKFQEI